MQSYHANNLQEKQRKREWLYTYGGGLTMITGHDRERETVACIYYIDALHLINLSDKLSGAKPKGEDGGPRQLSKPHDDGLLLLPLNYGPLFSPPPPLPCKGILSPSLSALPNPLLMRYNKRNSLTPPPAVI
jgi:hypothetical protein